MPVHFCDAALMQKSTLRSWHNTPFTAACLKTCLQEQWDKITPKKLTVCYPQCHFYVC